MDKLDKLDRKIIAALQRDPALSTAATGDLVGLSQNACWRRIQRLERDGFFVGRVNVFDAEKLGYPLTIYAIIRVREHDPERSKLLADRLAGMQEVLEFHRMSGDIDYMAKIIAKDMKHYDEIYKRIISIGGLLDVSSSFLMERIKCTQSVPVDI